MQKKGKCKRTIDNRQRQKDIKTETMKIKERQRRGNRHKKEECQTVEVVSPSKKLLRNWCSSTD